MFFKICEVVLPIVVGILAIIAIIMKLMGNSVGISMGLSVAALIVCVLTVMRFVRNLPRPGVCITSAGGSKFKAICSAYKFGLKEYFLKYYYYYKPVKVISEEENLSESAVKSKLMRGRQKMRKMIEEEYDE